MIPLKTLYDNYIDRPKLSEQKVPFEYIIPPTLKWVGTKISMNLYKNIGDSEMTTILLF